MKSNARVVWAVLGFRLNWQRVQMSSWGGEGVNEEFQEDKTKTTTRGQKERVNSHLDVS